MQSFFLFDVFVCFNLSFARILGLDFCKVWSGFVMNILIYGYGWTGKYALHLFESFGFSCYVVDDGIDSSFRNFSVLKDPIFLSYEDLKQKDLFFEICLIAVSGKPEVVEIIKNKMFALELKDSSGKDLTLKNIALDAYKDDFAVMFSEKFKDKFVFLESILQDDFYLSNFAKAYKTIKKEYPVYFAKQYQAINAAIDKKFPKLNVIAKMLQGSLKYGTMVHYPGFTAYVDETSNDKNLFLKEEIDFEALKNRDKDTKVIALFGGCTIKGDTFSPQKQIKKLLEKMLEFKKYKYIVLNCGIPAVTYENFLFYSAFLYPLKPDFIMNLFFAEPLTCRFDCEIMLKDYKMCYTPTYELVLRRDMGSSFPSRYELAEASAGGGGKS